MRVNLKANEIILKAADTRHYINDMKVLGKLILTNQRIYFLTVETEKGRVILELEPEAISEVYEFKNRILFSNGLCLLTHDGKELKFEVKDRDSWAEMIAKII
jgi:hypothetical protein